jgi:hypothetical protein
MKRVIAAGDLIAISGHHIPSVENAQPHGPDILIFSVAPSIRADLAED